MANTVIPEFQMGDMMTLTWHLLCVRVTMLFRGSAGQSTWDLSLICTRTPQCLYHAMQCYLPLGCHLSLGNTDEKFTATHTHTQTISAE